MQTKHTPHILTIIVDNEFGVLTRITAKIRREGWNIKTLAVAETVDPMISRITLTVECFEVALPTVVQRLSRLACVRSIEAYDPAACICRELAMVKTVCPPSEAMYELCKAHRATQLDAPDGGFCCELCAEPAALDAFIADMRALCPGITAVRTGPITLQKTTAQEEQ